MAELEEKKEIKKTTKKVTDVSQKMRILVVTNIAEVVKYVNEENIKKLSKIAKAYQCVDKVELLPFKKICQTKYDNMGIKFPFSDYTTPTKDKLAELNEVITVAQEANWLYEKFGDGEYQDILGFCKVATIGEIEEKGWSLTPGAYVGVPPVEDDGVNFEQRMQEIHQSLLSLQEEANCLMDAITINMKELGYGLEKS